MDENVVFSIAVILGFSLGMGFFFYLFYRSLISMRQFIEDIFEDNAFSSDKHKMRMSENPCLYCGCYDEDFGCTMFFVDKGYACPLNKSKQVK
ncbi:hypothetical protein ACS3UN_08010 [Oscillospiraceae bacterium LTW-04]|nr:hypothetical protein RBH76_02335 [Oscillospiraceae bacterium MB24-C1]